jgi:hypothetical protein
VLRLARIAAIIHEPAAGLRPDAQWRMTQKGGSPAFGLSAQLRLIVFFRTRPALLKRARELIRDDAPPSGL